jgi:outer membrane protein TolC
MPFFRSFAVLLLAVLTTAANSSQAQGQSYTLEEAVAYGLEHRTELQNATFDTYIAEQQVDEILSTGFPQLSGTASGQWNFRVQQFLLPNALITGNPEATGFQALQAGTPINGSVGVNLDQLLFDGTFFIGLKAAREFVDISEMQRAMTEEQLRYDITSAYYQALISDRQIALLEANVDRLKTMYDETKSLFDEGFVEKLDVERLQVNYNNLLLDLNNAQRLAALSRNLLKFQMGLPVSTDIDLETDVKSLEINMDEELLQDDFSYDNRIEYQLINQQIKLEGYNTRRFRAGYVPSAYLFGNYSYLFNGDFAENAEWVGFDVGSLGLRINVPLFDGFRKRSLIQQSKLTIKKLENQSLQLESAIDLELENTNVQLRNAKTSLDALKKNSDLARKVYDVSRTKYREGVGSSLEVNDASTQLKTAETNYLNGLLQYYIAKIAWDKARGKFLSN